MYIICFTLCEEDSTKRRNVVFFALILWIFFLMSFWSIDFRELEFNTVYTEKEDEFDVVCLYDYTTN